MTIRKKIALILLTATIVPMCFVGLLGYYHARHTLQSLRMEGLKSIADLKAERIEDFFTEHKKHITVARHRPTILKYTAVLAELSGDLSDPLYENIREELDRALEVYLPVYDFKNVILTDPEGKIIYQLNRSSGSDQLGRSFTDLWGASIQKSKKEVQFSNIFKSKIESDKFSIFLMAPIRSLQEQLLGMAAFEIDMRPIYELIQDTTGLGKTGETLIAKKDGDRALFLNPLRHDPEAALKRSAVFGERRASAIQDALKGNRGGGSVVDYRGQRVIAAWRYIPSLDWGMVAKIDLAEAFEPVTTLRDFVFVLVIAVILLSILAAFSIAKSFSDPIHALQQGLEEIGRGNLEHKVATQATDEIGQLGRAFDQMTDRLKAVTASRDELDAEIKERRHAQTALIESEKRFRDLVEHSLTGISIIQDDRIAYQNPEQERLLGPLPRPIKLQDTESIHPDDVEKVTLFYQSISAGKLPIGAMDFRFYPPGEKASRNHMKWVQCQASHIEYQGKDAILMNMMDITKTKELEHLLTIQDKMASLGRVAAGIAHEIRNPLSGINIYLNTLRKLYNQEGSEEKVEKILQHLQSASIKIESVIRRVMDFARPAEPKLTLIDVNAPITDAINLTAVTMRKSGIKIEKLLATDLPRSYADKNLIEEVVLNLLNNAAEAMKTVEAGKKIVVASLVENNRIVIRVCDSGPGVPLSIRDKIWDPYFTTKSEGTGIGLSFCHRIITDHGGSLRVSDSEWGGAEFRIELSIRKSG